MKTKYLILLTIAFLSFSSMGTTFVEMPVEDRLEEAVGAIRGVYTGKSYKKDPTGRVVTEASFRVDALSGISPNQIVNRNTFKVLLPGGQWNGMIYKISGTPDFSEGEEVVLILHKGDFGYTLGDLALSKFNIQQEEEGEVLISSVFADKDGIGKISVSEFDSLLENRFGGPLHAFNSNTFIHKVDDKKVAKSYNSSHYRPSVNREIASQNEKGSEDQSVPIIWFVFVLGIMGFLSSLLIRRGKE